MSDYNVVTTLSMVGRVCLTDTQKLWSAQVVLDLYGILEFQLCCGSLLLLT